MSTVVNIRGTSSSSFRVGKSGTTVYPSTTDPSLSNTIFAGDLWIKSDTGELYIWDGSEWDTFVSTLTQQTITGEKTFSAPTVISDDTESTGPETGALQVDGGVNIGKNLVLEGNLILNHSEQFSIEFSISTDASTVIDSFPLADYRSAKYLVQITQGTSYQTSEIMLIHDGTNSYTTEYAVLETNGKLGDLSSDVSGGNIRLSVEMGSASSATIKIHRTLVTV